MITFIPHEKIDKEKWDHCIAGSPNGRIYAYSWFLDRICPGWHAMIEDDYQALFPLTWGKKLGIFYLYQPFFTQQLGLFSGAVPDREKVLSFLKAVPGNYKFIDICLNASNETGPGNYQLFSNKTHELDLKSSYETLCHQYSDNAKRNIKKAIDHRVSIERE